MQELTGDEPVLAAMGQTLHEVAEHRGVIEEKRAA
jgi:hypothetical protein